MAARGLNAARARQLTREGAFDTVTGMLRIGAVPSAGATRGGGVPTLEKGANPALRPAPPAAWCPYGTDRPVDAAVAAAHAAPPRRMLRGSGSAKGVGGADTVAAVLDAVSPTPPLHRKDALAAAATVLARTRNYDPLLGTYVHPGREAAIATDELAGVERRRRAAAASLPPTIRARGSHSHNIITWEETPDALPRR